MVFTFDPQELKKQRLDSFLAENMKDVSRSRIQRLIKEGHVTVDGRAVKPGYELSGGESIFLEMPEPAVTDVLPENIPLDIVYEDSDLIVVNKPKGMAVHPSDNRYTGTLVNALLYHCGNSLSGINGVMRPGIVHRIDKDTTGLLVVCKNDLAHVNLSRQLSEHSISRKYIALVYNNFTEDEGAVDAPIGRSRADRKMMAVTNDGRRAVTHYRVLERFPARGRFKMPLTLTECRLETGRTHQIRVHMNYIGHPVAGDETYGIKKDPLGGHGQYLHAAELGFKHPTTGERLLFKAELPGYFKDTICELEEKHF